MDQACRNEIVQLCNDLLKQIGSESPPEWSGVTLAMKSGAIGGIKWVKSRVLDPKAPPPKPLDFLHLLKKD